MIYEISKEIGARLALRKVPLPVVFGPERTQSVAHNRERIVIQHDFESSDTFEALVVAQPNLGAQNPKSVFKRWQAATCLIYARSNLEGAAIQDHCRRGAAVLDRVLVALDHVVRARKNMLKITSGRFLALEDLKASDTWSGVVYELKFSVDRGVFDRDWEGEARPEATIEAINTGTAETVSTTNRLHLADRTEPF